jgi:PAT family beta-lactamase induction signal transducer AmpG
MIAGFFSAVWGIGVTLGGITGGRLTDRLGNRKAITGALITALVAISLLAVIPSQVFAWPLLVLFGLAYGYYETVFFATSMTVTDPRIAASMFAILMAVSNIGSGLGMVAGGGISDWIGFRWTFVFFAALNFLIIPLLPVISKRQYTKSEERSDKATQLSK